MRYVLKPELFAWGDDFDIFDESGKKVYFVDGAGIAVQNRLSFQDMAKKELAFIQQTMFTWGREYTISRAGRVVAKVSQQTLVESRCNFFIDVPGPNDLTAEGDFYNHEYVFQRSGKTAASVSKTGLSEGFGVDVPTGEDPVLLLASAIVIDLVIREGATKGSLYK
jgi:uncharacterized protein YxjI